MTQKVLLPKAPAGTSWLPIHSGESGDRVFRLSNGEAYAKVGHTSALADERDRTDWFFGTGLPGPEILDWVPSGHFGCLVTRAVPGVPADTLKPSALKASWPSVCQLLKTVHDLPLKDCPFERGLSKMVPVATDVVARQAVNRNFLDPTIRHNDPDVLLADVKRELPVRLMQEQAELAVCHGDACLPNILVDPDSHRCLGVVDLGRVGVADRYVDLALLIANARERWQNEIDMATATAELFAISGISNPDRGRLAFYPLLDALTWG